MNVIPLKSSVIFKHVFSDPVIFRQFAKDVLDIDLNIDKVHTEYEYPKPVGFVRSRYDLFAEDVAQKVIVEIQHVKEGDFFDRFLYYHLISMVEQVGSHKEYEFGRTVYTVVMLNSVPADGSVNFSCAISDMNPIDEFERIVAVYPHRLLFLCPRKVNDKTPPRIKKWLTFIEDSFDGQVSEENYTDAYFQQILRHIEEKSIDRNLLAEIKDESAWENVQRKTRDEGRLEGLLEGQLKGRLEGRLEERLAVAQNLLNLNFDINTIATCTGLSEAEILQLRDEKS